MKKYLFKSTDYTSKINEEKHVSCPHFVNLAILYTYLIKPMYQSLEPCALTFYKYENLYIIPTCINETKIFLFKLPTDLSDSVYLPTHICTY